MPADEKLRRIAEYLGTYARVVIAGISAYVLHQYIHVLAFPSERLGEDTAYVTTIDISIYGFQRTELRQFLGHLERTDVPCVPYLVARLEVMQILLIPVYVGVSDAAYPLHLLPLKSAIIFAVSSSPKMEVLMQRS